MRMHTCVSLSLSLSSSPSVSVIFPQILSHVARPGDLHDYVGLAPNASNDLVLYRVGAMAQNWAKQNKLELSIKPLTESALNYSSSTYPELDSQIKAARTRVLFEFVCKICLDVVT